VHAAVVGVLVLAATVMIFYRLKVEYDISHPDYMILIGLLLPIPCALLGGKLVSLIFQSNHSASRAA
jgi:hypothetical protein